MQKYCKDEEFILNLEDTFFTQTRNKQTNKQTKNQKENSTLKTTIYVFSKSCTHSRIDNTRVIQKSIIQK